MSTFLGKSTKQLVKPSKACSDPEYSILHIKVKREDKAAWVAKADGAKLRDWVVEQLNNAANS